jgi:hypothetical protein
MIDTPDPNAPDEPEVATGDRREEMHYEPDPDQLVVARATVKPKTPLPPDEHTAAVDHGELNAEPPIGDVRVVPPSPSVWDARPPDDEDRSDNLTGR